MLNAPCKLHGTQNAPVIGHEACCLPINYVSVHIFIVHPKQVECIMKVIFFVTFFGVALYDIGLLANRGGECIGST